MSFRYGRDKTISWKSNLVTILGPDSSTTTTTTSSSLSSSFNHNSNTSCSMTGQFDVVEDWMHLTESSIGSVREGNLEVSIYSSPRGRLKLKNKNRSQNQQQQQHRYNFRYFGSQDDDDTTTTTDDNKIDFNADTDDSFQRAWNFSSKEFAALIAEAAPALDLSSSSAQNDEASLTCNKNATNERERVERQEGHNGSNAPFNQYRNLHLSSSSFADSFAEDDDLGCLQKFALHGSHGDMSFQGVDALGDDEDDNDNEEEGVSIPLRVVNQHQSSQVLREREDVSDSLTQSNVVQLQPQPYHLQPVADKTSYKYHLDENDFSSSEKQFMTRPQHDSSFSSSVHTLDQVEKETYHDASRLETNSPQEQSSRNGLIRNQITIRAVGTGAQLSVQDPNRKEKNYPEG